MAKIVPLKPPATPEQPREPRRPGSLAGLISIGPEFFKPLPDDELARWNCEVDEG